MDVNNKISTLHGCTSCVVCVCMCAMHVYVFCVMVGFRKIKETLTAQLQLVILTVMIGSCTAMLFMYEISVLKWLDFRG